MMRVYYLSVYLDFRFIIGVFSREGHRCSIPAWVVAMIGIMILVLIRTIFIVLFIHWWKMIFGIVVSGMMLLFMEIRQTISLLIAGKLMFLKLWLLLIMGLNKLEMLESSYRMLQMVQSFLKKNCLKKT